MGDDKVYHNFQKRTDKLKNIVQMVRSCCYSNWDEGGTDIVLCVECEEWTHVKFNQNSCLLDLLGDLTVESIDVRDDELWLWIKTDDYNWFGTDSDRRANDDQGADGREDHANKDGN